MKPRRKGLYRRGDNTGVWHFRKGCSALPTANYHESRRPVGGKICEECIALEKKNSGYSI